MENTNGINLDIDDVGVVYFKNEEGNWIEIKGEHRELSQEEILKEKLEASMKLDKLMSFKLELEELYKKYGITIEDDYDSLVIEFNDNYEYDTVLAKINSEIKYYERVKGGY